MVAPSHMLSHKRLPQIAAVQLLKEFYSELTTKEIMVYVKTNYPDSDISGVKFSDFVTIHMYFYISERNR